MTMRIYLSLIMKLLAASAIATAMLPAVAGPGELTVLTEPAFAGAMTAAAKAFEKETGQHVALMIVKPNQVQNAFKGMDHPDLAVLSDPLLDKVIQSSHVQGDTKKSVGQVGIGVVVKRGAAKPDVATPVALKQALTAAKSIVYGDPGDSAAGKQVVQVIAALGLGDTLKAKTTVSASANPMSQVALGAVELGLHPVNEALETEGVTVAGTVPAELAQPARYSLALVADAPNLSEAHRLIAFLSSSTGRGALAEKGVQEVR
jgi:molybdate transport system substrate-binding protein